MLLYSSLIVFGASTLVFAFSQKCDRNVSHPSKRSADAG